MAATKSTSTDNTTPKGAITMAELLAKAGKKANQFTKGQRVTGTLLSKTPEALIFDVGGKSEGIVKEKGYTDAKDFIETLKVGQSVMVTVLVPETRDGITILALKDAMRDISWEKLLEAKKDSTEVPVLGKGVNAAGFVVDVMGIEGFIPMSQMGKDAVENAQNLVGKYFKARVMEVDKVNKKVVLSEKEVSEAGDIALIKKAMVNVKEGEVYDGVVTTVASFGAFVKIEVLVGKVKAHVEGLVHVSELSFSKVALPSDVISVGDRVKVRVLAARDGKLALSIKQAAKDPWTSVAEKYKPEAKITGKVTRISDFGVFVELEPGIEGLIHITKIPPTHKLIIGMDVKCTIEEINVKDKRISLGLVLTSVPVGYK
ncbi:MAG TPA: S1 RNA-binding domain-containing protein [Patescibacteria group bacterium]|nr:S1 RNA-binding domain-containing protein [Patescibacteria group bacterium]